MRLTLEQLKAMSDGELYNTWLDGQFPFEFIRGCGGGCLTMHGARGCNSHITLVGAVRQMGFEDQRNEEKQKALLRAHLEELYALRLFYDSLYPQPAESESPELEVADGRKEVFGANRV